MWLPRFACPACREPTDGRGVDIACRSCGLRFEQRDGVFRFLTNGARSTAADFSTQYRVVRQHDGYRRASADYYRMLPAVPRNDPRAAEWRIRRESYATLERHALPAVWVGSVNVLDVGAGCGWISHRLASLGHNVVAVDRLDDDVDGLAVCRHYPVAFPAVQADFDALPFEPHQFDLAIFAGSLHYSPNPAATLREAARMLGPGGALVVMDSPMFRRAADGEAMVSSEARRMAAIVGGVIRPGVGYLTFDATRRTFEALALRASFHPSRGPLSWRVRRPLARLRLGRAPATFGVWVAR
jgi:SAM-dependent methyltransferase